MTEKLPKNKLSPLEKPDLVSEFDSWSPETEESLNELLRALRRKKGFGLFFVQCNPAQGQRVIAAVKDRLPQKRLIQIELHRESETLYGELLERYQAEPFEIVCITGAEQAMYGYEDTKRLAGWTSDEIYNYSWKGLPPLLSHLNRQREAFEEHLPVSLIFLVPSFVVDYFVQRAPDFFDWRSGFFKLADKRKEPQSFLQELLRKEFKDCLDLTDEKRIEKILRIKEQILNLGSSDAKQKSDLLCLQGYLFTGGDNDARALDCFNRALIVSPQNYIALGIKASFLNDLERYEEAIENFDYALELQAKYYFAWHGRGISLNSLERYEEAIKSFDRALELQPDHHHSWYCRGISLCDLERYEEAIENFDRALELQPDHHHSWYYRGISLCDLERYEEAIENFDRALELQPNHYHAWYLRGVSLRNLERYEEAIESFDRALELQPDHYYAWCSRGFSLGSLEYHEDAVESYDRALELKPDYHFAWYGRGVSICNLDHYQEAIEDFDRALELQPDYYFAWGDRGIALGDLGCHEEAIESYDRALELQPDYYSAWQNKGYALYQLDRYQEALWCFQKLTEMRPDDGEAWNNQGFLTLAEYSYKQFSVLGKPLLIRQIQDCKGVVLADSPDREICLQSLASLSKAMCLDAKMTLAWANSSFPAYYLGRYQDALEYCNRAFELDPQNEEAMNDAIYSNRGFILLQLQNPGDALEAFDNALKLNPQLDEAWIGKGTALYQLARYKEAVYTFTQALYLNHPLAQANLDSLQDCIH